MEVITGAGLRCRPGCSSTPTYTCEQHKTQEKLYQMAVEVFSKGFDFERALGLLQELCDVHEVRVPFFVRCD